ncbi:hypothetical protein [Alloyangia pacifica]|uniref:hypothetical protein n=1 Tax=Alloyangia pacifica TaxID=311180 RepID=UPI001CFD8E02|nr:hypothetical protein [Alloyangia pacifica]
MPVSFRILRNHGLVYARYEGHARLSDTTRAIDDLMSHPDFRQGHKHLVDLSGLTSWDHDYVELMKIQAKRAEVFCGMGSTAILLYFAPTAVAFQVSTLALNCWDGLDCAVARVQQNEEDCLTLLGLRERSIAELLEAAG